MTSGKEFTLLQIIMTLKKQSYPFIYTNIYLSACVDSKDNYSYILMEKINPKTKEVEYSQEISCVHTAVYVAPISELDKLNSDDNFLNKMLEIRSTEYPEPMDLTPEENFFALTSWVQGISEAGLDCFLIQSQFEEYYDLLLPLTQSLLSFLIKVEPRVITKLLHYIKKMCVFEGEPHFASLNANLKPILNVLILNHENIGFSRPKDQYVYSKVYFNHFHINFEEYLEQILELKPSVLLFLNSKYKFLIENDERIKKLPDYEIIKKKNSVVSGGKRYWSYYNGDYLILSISNKMKDISGIQGLEHLQKLDFLSLGHAGISDITGLQQFTDLSHLSLSFNQIRSIRGLEKLTNLRYLTLRSNEIEDISCLSALEKLETLDLSNNPLINIIPLSNLVNLRELYLLWTFIDDVSCLESLHNLQQLEIGSPNLRRLESLSSLVNLSRLILRTPNFEDVESIIELPNLRRLSIMDSCLSEEDKKKLNNAEFRTTFIV